MSNLQVIENSSNPMTELLSEVIPDMRVDEAGVCYASIRAVARLCGVTHQTLSKYVTSGSNSRTKIVKALRSAGFEGGSISGFSSTGIPILATQYPNVNKVKVKAFYSSSPSPHSRFFPSSPCTT
mgnify:CR=1 FL=1